jgi:lipid A 3-O-deacylase
MIRSTLLVFVFGANFLIHASAQRIDNNSVFKTMSSDHYFRIHYDNDYFTRTDLYYTQGIELELVSPLLKDLPLYWFLIRPRQSEIKYGICIDHVAYTPTSTSTNQIQYGDRPFAACLSLKIFAMATDCFREQRISTGLIAGIIGPGAGGKEMQTDIHRWLSNPLPMGWQNQIQNDLILNYQLNYEKEFLNCGNVFLLNGASEIRTGTLNDKISGGVNFMLGEFSDPYRSTKKKKKFSYYLYGQPMASLIGYDASLEGGVFDHKSPYTIAPAGISRATFQADYGIVVCLSTLYLEYCQSYLTREFDSGHYHRWGGIRIGLTF